MSELLNLVGLSTGVVLYAMLLAMVVRAGRAPGAPRFDPLLLATAVLGLVWNLCALPAYELPKVGIDGPFTLLIAVGFQRARLSSGRRRALGAARRARQRQRVAAGRSDRRVAAYAVSAIAAALLHARAAWAGAPLPSPLGMRLLTYTFIALVVPLAAVTRGQPGARRALWAAALSIFAVSALHLSQLHQGDASWPVELLGHHASLPLAFAILYQDFPFALADLFLKRALTLLALVGAALLAIAAFGAVHSPELPLRDPRDVGILVTLWVATALLYPRCAPIGWFVDTVVLDRPDYESLRADIGRRVQRTRTSRRCSTMCAQLAPALSARVVAGASLRPAPLGRDRRRPRRPAGRRRRRRPGRRAAALRARGRRADRRPAAAVRRSRRARRHRRRCSAAASTPSASRASATSASCASRRSASSPPKRSCARCARRSTRTSCSTR